MFVAVSLEDFEAKILLLEANIFEFDANAFEFDANALEFDANTFGFDANTFGFGFDANAFGDGFDANAFGFGFDANALEFDVHTFGTVFVIKVFAKVPVGLEVTLWSFLALVIVSFLTVVIGVNVLIFEAFLTLEIVSLVLTLDENTFWTVGTFLTNVLVSETLWKLEVVVTVEVVGLGFGTTFLGFIILLLILGIANVVDDDVDVVNGVKFLTLEMVSVMIGVFTFGTFLTLEIGSVTVTVGVVTCGVVGTFNGTFWGRFDDETLGSLINVDEEGFVGACLFGEIFSS